jgi:hypothetical protein
VYDKEVAHQVLGAKAIPKLRLRLPPSNVIQNQASFVVQRVTEWLSNCVDFSGMLMYAVLLLD